MITLRCPCLCTSACLGVQGILLVQFPCQVLGQRGATTLHLVWKGREGKGRGAYCVVLSHGACGPLYVLWAAVS